MGKKKHLFKIHRWQIPSTIYSMPEGVKSSHLEKATVERQINTLEEYKTYLETLYPHLDVEVEYVDE